jgi:predicted ATPase
VLVEGDDELRALSGLASAVGRGAGVRVAVITGEAGTGKSRLAQEFASSLPDGWWARTVRVTPTNAELPPVPEVQPLALVIDDAHFLDPSALRGIPGLLDEMGPRPVLLLLTFRLGFHPASTAEMRALAGLVRDLRATELRLTPLSPGGTGQMAAAMGSYATADLHARTGGNPFWVEEVLRGGDRVPWTVVEALASQVEALPEEAGELARALAVAGEPVPLAAAAQLVGDLDAAGAALAEAGLARRDEDLVTLRHTLAAEAIATRLSRSELAVWHGRLARALEGEDVERDRVARHWAAAGDADRAATIAMTVAPDLRVQRATRRAFECFRIATRRPPPDERSAAALFEEAALTAARIGEYEAMRGWVEMAQRGYRAAGLPDRA